MKKTKQTAVLLVEESQEKHPCSKLMGIFTSKDVVLRVLATGLDSKSTSLIRVMTPHPDTITMSTTVLDGLKKMLAGRYLHLPVTNESNVPIALVDVLALSLSTLEKVS
jgi:CBS domain-containing protein